MLAPLEKLRRGGNRFIQVVITRNCTLFNCSNCTQLLPFRKDAREMSLECIEETLVGLQGWPGIVAMFGGTPQAHSRFIEVCSLWKKYIPNQQHRGLWTNDLMKHGQVSRDTFWPKATFNLNVHSNSEAAKEMRKWLPGIPVYGETGEVHHATMLADYRDFGYTDEQWNILRENCTIGNKWSAGVYQGSDGHPYAYFCEVAGSLTGIQHNKHEEVGVPATAGWWKQPMSHFQHQVEQCCNKGCGVPLKIKGHRDTEDTYDVSSKWVSLTEKRSGKVLVHSHESVPGNVHDNTDYCGFRKPRV